VSRKENPGAAAVATGALEISSAGADRDSNNPPRGAGATGDLAVCDGRQCVGFVRRIGDIFAAYTDPRPICRPLPRPAQRGARDPGAAQHAEAPMNRATRRRAARDRRRGRARWTAAEREAGLRELTSAALCKFTASIVGPHPDHILGFLAAAARGDDHAQSGMQAIGRWLSSAAELSPGEQHQCLFCRREFVNEMPIAFAIMTPFARIGPHALVCGICASCAHGNDDSARGRCEGMACDLARPAANERGSRMMQQ
jgi:hypothetical protein